MMIQAPQIVGPDGQLWTVTAREQRGKRTWVQLTTILIPTFAIVRVQRPLDENGVVIQFPTRTTARLLKPS